MTPRRPPGETPRRPFVVASLPSEGLRHMAGLVAEHADVVDEVSPRLYRLGTRDGVDLLGDACAQARDTLRAVARPLLPAVSDRVAGERPCGLVARVLHEPARAAHHVRALVDFVRRHGYAGVEVDFTTLRADDRDAFTAFTARLGDALHDDGARLAVTVGAKTHDGDGEEHDAAQDYRTLGEIADELRLRTYGYHWETSPPGPLAPVDWIRDVLTYATSIVPPHKIVLGTTAAGYRWVDGRGAPISHWDARALAECVAGGVRWDPMTLSPWFSARAGDGTVREVWFEDARSIAAKRCVAAEAGVHALWLWLAAAPDPQLWAELARPDPIPS